MITIEKEQHTQNFFEQYRMSITDSGYAEVDASWSCRYVCSPFSRLYYVSEGEGEIRVGEECIRLLPGYVYLIPLGTVYQSDCRGILHHLYFHFNIDTPNGYDLLRGQKCVGTAVPQETIEHLKKLYKSNLLMDQMELLHAVYASLHTLLRREETPPAFQESYSEEVRKTMEYIRENLSAKLTVERIAQDLFLSKNTIFKRFRAEVGLPIGKYIDKLLFFRAEQLLTKSNLSIKEISDQLGFCDQFYFSRRFLQYFEERPQAYRARTQKMNQI